MQSAQVNSALVFEFAAFVLQDQLSADMYSFASKEGDYARYYVMVSAQNAHI